MSLYNRNYNNLYYMVTARRFILNYNQFYIIVYVFISSLGSRFLKTLRSVREGTDHMFLYITCIIKKVVTFFFFLFMVLLKLNYKIPLQLGEFEYSLETSLRGTPSIVKLVNTKK